MGHIFLYSQSKKETIIWLEQNLKFYNDYSLYNSDHSKKLFSESNTFILNDDFILINKWNIRDSIFENYYYILELKSLTFINNKKGYFVEYHLEPYGSMWKEFVGEELTFNGDYIYGTKDKKLAYSIFFGYKKPSKNLSTITIKASDNKIFEKNLSERILKAFAHLVDLCGGKMVVKDLF
jgi:hypothetical protein